MRDKVLSYLNYFISHNSSKVRFHVLKTLTIHIKKDKFSAKLWSMFFNDSFITQLFYNNLFLENDEDNRRAAEEFIHILSYQDHNRLMKLCTSNKIYPMIHILSQK